MHQTGMALEQLPPNKPNFLLVVLLAAAVMLVIFVIAYFTVRWDGKHLTFRHRSSEPNSRLVQPGPRLAELS